MFACLFFLLSFFQPIYAQTPEYSDLDEIFYHINQQDIQELKRLSSKRLEMLRNRQEALKQEREGTLRVAILGNSALKYTKEGFNDELLQLMFDNIVEADVHAVFFIGPFVAPGISLDTFQKLTKQYLGDIPLYLTPDSQEIIEKFKLPVSESFQRGYTILLKNTFFAVFSNGDGEEPEQLIEWLDSHLQRHIGNYRFVLGNPAAFSTHATEGSYEGMDRWPYFRNQFWDLLRRGDVEAYFGSNEILYDRSYRTGVWQILTGGAGATRTYEVRDDTFYHFVLLTIPQDRSGPLVEVFDIQGRKRDGLRLNTQMPAITQFRISTSVN